MVEKKWNPMYDAANDAFLNSYTSTSLLEKTLVPRTDPRRIKSGQPPSSYAVIVDNIPYPQMRKLHLTNLFSGAGQVKKAILQPSHGKPSCGYGIVHYMTLKEADRAIQLYDGFQLAGDIILSVRLSGRRSSNAVANLVDRDNSEYWKKINDKNWTGFSDDEDKLHTDRASTSSQITSPESDGERSGHQCMFCQNKAGQQCSVCKYPYCSRECQEKSWPYHKASCRSVGIQNNRPMSVIPNTSTLPPPLEKILSPQDFLSDTSETETEGFAVESMDYPPCFQLLVTYICSDGGVFGLPMTGQYHTEQLALQQKNLQDYFSVADRRHIAVDMVLGSLYASRYDTEWCRAKLVDVGNEFVDVFYLDYGNTERVLKRDLLTLPDFASRHKGFAHKFFVRGLSLGDDLHPIVQILRGKVINRLFDASLVQRPSIVGLGGVVDLFDSSEGCRSFIDLMQDYVSESKKERRFFSSIPSVCAEGLMDVVITHVESVTDFWVNLAGNMHTLLDLPDRLLETYSNAEPAAYYPFSGEVCAAKSSLDGLWYRVCALLYSTPNMLVCRAIDYGTMMTIPIQHVHPLSGTFLDLPRQALQCKLIESTLTDSSWPEDMVQWWKTRISTKQCKLQHVRVGTGGDSHIVSLVDPNMVDLLLELRTKFHNIAVPQPVEPSNINLPEPLRLELHKPIEAVVCYVATNTDIFVMPDISQNLTQMHQLALKMNTFYADDELGPPQHVYPGYFCAGFYNNDGWYRALVSEVGVGGLVRVNFIDYGNFEWVKIESLRQLQSEFRNVEVGSVRCRLVHSVDHMNLDEVRALLSDKEITVTPICLEEDQVYLVQATFLGGSPIIPALLEPDPAPLPQLHLDLGVMIPCIVTHITDGGTVSVIPDVGGHIKSVASLLDEMTLFYESGGIPVGTPSIGHIYACKFTDGYWYRGEVLCQRNDLWMVLFIDYGNEDPVELSSMKVLESGYTTVPKGCVNCSIKDLDTKLIPAARSKLEAQLINQEVKVTVLALSGSIHIVDVYLVGGKLNVDIPALELKAPLPPVQSAGLLREAPMLEANAPERVLVTFVEESGLIHVQPCTDQHARLMQDLQEGMAVFYQTNREQLVSVTTGQFCACQYTLDGCWYRASVKECVDGTVRVFFVDYGNEDIVQMSNIKALSDQFFGPARGSLCCRLSDSSNLPAGKLSAWLRQKLTDVEIEIVPVEYEGGVHIVRATFASSASDVLSDFLASFSTNCHSEGTRQSSQACAVQGSDLTLTNSCTQSLSRSSSPSTTHVSQNASSASGLVSRNVSSLPPPRVLPTGKPILGLVVHVDDHGRLYIQPDVDGNLVCMARLLEDMTSAYNNSSAHAVPDPQVEQLCACRFPDDHHWYRAVITWRTYTDCQVLYVDYGNEALVSTKDVRTLEPSFHLPPRAAVCCVLYGSPPSMHKDDVKRMRDLVGRTLLVDVVQRGKDEYTVSVNSTTNMSSFELVESLRRSWSSCQTQPTDPSTQPLIRLPGSRGSLSVQPSRSLSSPSWNEITESDITTSKELTLLTQLSSSFRDCVESYTFFLGIVTRAFSPSFFFMVVDNSTVRDTIQSSISKVQLVRKSNVVPGDPVLVTRTGGQPRSRGQVLDLEDDGSATVWLVDEGTLWNTTSTLYELPNTCVQVPCLSLCCSLADISPKGSEWTVPAVEFFRTVALSPDLRGTKVVNNRLISQVNLYCPDSVSSLLARKGLAISTCRQTAQQAPAKQSGWSQSAGHQGSRSGLPTRSRN